MVKERGNGFINAGRGFPSSSVWLSSSLQSFHYIAHESALLIVLNIDRILIKTTLTVLKFLRTMPTLRTRKVVNGKAENYGTFAVFLLSYNKK
jgi:hypothetical protein